MNDNIKMYRPDKLPTIEDDKHTWREFWLELERTLRRSMSILLERSRNTESDWIDTKLNIATGKPVDPTDPIRGKLVIYGWVQGRALESFSRHARWWAEQDLDAEARELSQQLREVVARLAAHLQSACAKHGRLRFMMNPEGQALDIVEGKPVISNDTLDDRPHSLTDLFYAKGLCEAGHLLGQDDLLYQAESMLGDIINDIRAGRLWFDQVPLDPRNQAGEISGRHSQAPYMLGIAAATRGGVLNNNHNLLSTAEHFAKQLLTRHVASTASGLLRPGDFWEFVDDEGKPYIREGVLHSDPGHAIEAAGFYFNLVSCLKGHHTSDNSNVNDWARVLTQNFENGWTQFGLVKAYDLLNRQVIYNQLPWWPLPEAMRAVVVALPYLNAEHRPRFTGLFIQATKAMFRYFMNPTLGMAIPSLGPDGRPLDTIPAVPDADPGYHTNLCLIDVLSTVKQQGWEDGLPC